MEQSRAEEALKQGGLKIRDEKDIFNRDFGIRDDEDAEGAEELLARITGAEAEAKKEEIEAWRAVYEEELGNIAAGIVKIDLIIPNPEQPRKYFNLEKLGKMADTIKVRGRPTNHIILTPHGDKFMLISGERRWRALEKLGVTKVFAIIVKDPGDAVDILEESIVANLHQENLNIVETAWSFKNLMKKRGWSQAELARRMGKEQSEITSIFKVFRLHEQFQAMLLFEKVQPGPILQLGTYAMDAQQKLFDALMEEVKEKYNGKMPHPNIVARILRRLAESKGIKPLKPKKGKAVSTHAEMVFRSIKKAAEKFAKELVDLPDMGKEALRTAKDPRAFEILSVLGRLEEDIHDARIELGEKLQI